MFLDKNFSSKYKGSRKKLGKLPIRLESFSLKAWQTSHQLGKLSNRRFKALQQIFEKLFNRSLEKFLRNEESWKTYQQKLGKLLNRSLNIF